MTNLPAIHRVVRILEAVRESKGLSKSTLSRACGKNSQWWDFVSTGRQHLRLLDLDALEDALGVEFDLVKTQRKD